MPGDGLFGPIFTTDALLAASDDQAWLQAMLDAEAALAGALADTGVIPAEAATAVRTATSDAAMFDAGAIGRGARAGGNPVIPLVRAVSERVDAEWRSFVHWGATSQDILDTAAALVAARSLGIIEADAAGLAAGCASLAERHRATVMAGRTLLQQAVPITFGLKAAGWMVGVNDAARAVAAARTRLAAQLGGAAGTLAALGGAGPEVATRFAARLGLAAPVLPWHSARQRTAELGCALGILAGTAGKIAVDVALLMQTEVGEAAEPGGGSLSGGGASGPGGGTSPAGTSPAGGSSTMPHKRNPVAAITALAAARRAHALVPVLLGSLVAEHERAAGGWHAEWETLTDLLRLAGGATAHMRDVVDGLEVDAGAMAANMSRTLMAERVAFALVPHVGRREASDAVGEAAREAAERGIDFGAALASHPVTGVLGTDRIAELLDPAGYLGAAGVWVERALGER